MDEKSTFVEPYKASGLHKIYDWIDRLPGPYWLFSVILLIFTGTLNNIVAWNNNVLTPGEINWDYAFTGFFLCYYLFSLDFLIRLAKTSLLEFRHTLNIDEVEFEKILFEFTRLPARNTLVIFMIGAMIGLMMGIYLLPTALEMNYSFPALEVPMYSLSVGMVAIVLYLLIRTLRLINRLFEKVENIDIFNQNSIYSISRYSAWLIVVIAIPTYLSFVLLPSFSSVTSYYYLVFLVVAYIVVLTIFWLPLRGVNHKLILEKRRLTSELNLRIKTTLGLLNSRIDNQDFKNIVDFKETLESLKIEKEIIESLHTAPWKASTITGLTTAIFLPLFVTLLSDLISWYLKL